LPFGRVNPLNAKYADVAFLEIGDELADGGWAQVNSREIERDVLTGENLARAHRMCEAFDDSAAACAIAAE